ncbi:hypothetical protein [Brachyspira intermedia]|uniref:hypothetical protein n=1 Tax=Brachyspira intermedia TaxID=84377 RepID=UPI003007E139
MNKKITYIIFIISVLIFISGCKNNATNPSTFEEIGKYRGTWMADKCESIDFNTGKWIEKEYPISVEINNDTDVLIMNVPVDSVKYLKDTIDTFDLYVPVNVEELPPPQVIGTPNEVYYRMTFNSYNSATMVKIAKTTANGNSYIFSLVRWSLKKIS